MDTILKIDVCLRLTVQFQCRPEAHTLPGEMRGKVLFEGSGHKWHDLTQLPNYASCAFSNTFTDPRQGPALRLSKFPMSSRLV